MEQEKKFVKGKQGRSFSFFVFYYNKGTSIQIFGGDKRWLWVTRDMIDGLPLVLSV